jgi:23S rRNA pseudouridine1911/1915/1917 synthase
MFEIIYEDDDIVVVDKPSGMIVHPAPGRGEKALSDELVRRYPEMKGVGSVERPGVVHRLDVETSGVMVFARNQRSYLALRREFESHRSVGKTYLAVVHGRPENPCGTLATQIGRRSGKKKMRVAETGGQDAITHWRTLSRKGAVSLVEFRIETGRTHQIRVHAAYLGCPIVGDRLYGDAAKDAKLRRRPARLLLHAVELAFPHPAGGGRVSFMAEVPPEIIYV